MAEARGMVRYENPSTGQPVDGFGVPEVDGDDVLVVQGLAARVPGRRRWCSDTARTPRTRSSTSALADALNGQTPDADVALVTRGGDLDEDAGASEDDTVVFATVV